VEDTISSQPVTIKEECILESHQNRGWHRICKDLVFKIELAIGMKVMVTNNLETDLDITNGARGEIMEIILYTDKQELNIEESSIKLQYLHICICVKLET
jgi:hypothetical protein